MLPSKGNAFPAKKVISLLCMLVDEVLIFTFLKIFSNSTGVTDPVKVSTPVAALNSLVTPVGNVPVYSKMSPDTNPVLKKTFAFVTLVEALIVIALSTKTDAALTITVVIPLEDTTLF
ncbi:hypothetical protein AP058_00416 [Flavobacterium sp. TAB 87]|nr:hypothetical protein AP058_00416 [Flavobacterium sp. TAB 87]